MNHHDMAVKTFKEIVDREFSDYYEDLLTWDSTKEQVKKIKKMIYYASGETNPPKYMISRIFKSLYLYEDDNRLSLEEWFPIS